MCAGVDFREKDFKALQGGEKVSTEDQVQRESRLC